MRKQRTEYAVVDTTTGENIGRIDLRSPAVKLHSTYYGYNRGADFVKFFLTDKSAELIDKITKPEARLLICMERFISFDNSLREEGRANGRQLDAQTLASALKMEYRNTRKLLTGLRQKGILDEIKGKGIVMSADLYRRGDDPDNQTRKNFVKIFRYDGQALTNGESWLLVKIRFLVSYTDGALRVGGHRNGTILTLKELAEVTGEKYKNLYKLLSGLKKKNICSEFIQNETRDKVIAVNPAVILKGKDILKETINHFKNE